MDERLAGMQPTGRTIEGPAADLVEVASDVGLRHLVLRFADPYREHAALNAELAPALGALEAPDVPGLLPLVSHDPAAGHFVYATGTSWTLFEIVHALADQGEQGGVRAGLELCYLASEILVDAHDRLAEHGLYAHGSLDPRRILVKPDGQVQILGYGLPPVDMRVHLDTQRRPPDEDTFRYAPPERFEELDEDLASDLYVLALIGLELTMCRPVYDGLVDDVRQQASRGDAVRRLYQWREKLPDTVREAYGRALKPDPDSRYRDGVDFVYAFHDLLGSLDADGPGLVELIKRLRSRLPHHEVASESSVEEPEPEPASELPPPRKPRPQEADEVEDEPGEQRWGRVSRAREGEATPQATPAAPVSPRDRLRDRLKSRSERGAPPPPAQTARDRLKARLRAREGGDGAGRAARRASAASGASEPNSRAGADEPATVLAQPLPDLDDSPPPPPARRIPPPPRATAAPAEPPSRRRPPSEGAARAVRTEAPPVPAPAAPRPVEEPAPRRAAVPAGSAAAALLERLRAAAGSSSAPEPVLPTSRAATSTGPAPGAKAPSVDAPAQAGALDDDVDAADLLSEEVEIEAPRVPLTLGGTEGAPASAEVETQRLPRSMASEALEPESASLSLSTLGDAHTIAFHVTQTGKSVRQAELPAGITVAEGAWQLAERFEAVHTDLQGQLVGWYVIEQDGARISGGARIEELDPRRPIDLRFVPNEAARVTVEVRGADEPIRFSTPIGTAVPFRYLVTHLQRWLGLPEGRWSVQVDGTTVLPQQILAELEPSGETLIVVSR